MIVNAFTPINKNHQTKFASKEKTAEQPAVLTLKKVGGVGPSIGALTVSQVASLGAAPISLGLIIRAMQKQGNIPESEIKTLKDATAQVIKKSGLDSHGVNIEWLKPFEEVQSKKEILLADLIAPYDAVKNGRNAFFVMKDGALPSIKGFPEPVKKNTILMPENKITFAAFHELGHAMNANLSKAGNALQKFRPLALFIPSLVALYGACSRKSKPDADGNLTKKQKINNGIRNNAGKIAFIATLPMLIEEAMATKKGLKFAKEILSPELYKKVAKGNKVAFLSYLTTSIFAGITAWAAVKVKDNMIAKKERKQEELIQSTINS